MRTKVFITASNEHRTVSLGGSRRNDSGYATLNTDNDKQSNCALECQARVRSGVSLFSVTLPRQENEWCKTQLWFDEPGQLAAIEDGRTFGETFWALRERLEYLDNVKLGHTGYSLAEALAAIEVCRRLNALVTVEAHFRSGGFPSPVENKSRRKLLLVS